MSDMISRQTVISAICNACGKIDCDKMDKCEKLQLPPANSSEFPNNSDTISRQAAIDALREEVELEYDEKDEQWYYIEADMAIGAIERLPSADRPKGKWIPYLPEGLRYKCSECESKYDTPWHFCPNCGCYNGGRQEDIVAWRPMPSLWKGEK